MFAELPAAGDRALFGEAEHAGAAIPRRAREVGATAVAQPDMTRRGLDEVVRASPHCVVEPAPVDQAIEAAAAVSRSAR